MNTAFQFLLELFRIGNFISYIHTLMESYTNFIVAFVLYIAVESGVNFRAELYDIINFQVDMGLQFKLNLQPILVYINSRNKLILTMHINEGIGPSREIRENPFRSFTLALNSTNR